MGEDAVELARTQRPHVVLLDINLPGISGLEATRLIRKYAPGTKILGMSLHTQPAYARKMMHQGARGYVTKSSPRAELFQAFTELLSGKKYICQVIKDNLSDQEFTHTGMTDGLQSLTDRELEVIARVRLGRTSREIAEALGISTKTVEVHRSNILRKLQLKNTVALINFLSRKRVESIGSGITQSSVQPDGRQ